VNVHVAAKKLNYLKQSSATQVSTLAKTVLGKRIAVLCTAQEIMDLEPSWRDLESKNITTPSVFQSFEWVKSWCDTHLSHASTDQLKVTAGYLNGNLVFILPLVITSRFGLKILQWITEPLGQYGDVLCAKGQDVSTWMALALGAIKQDKSVDLIRLRHVRQDSLVEAFAKSKMIDAKYYERAPYLDLSTFKGDAEYDARYSSTQRKRRKKIRKHLEEMGEVKFATLNTSAEIATAIETSIIEKNAWLSDRGRFNRIMGCPRHVNFLKALAKSTSEHFAMTTTELTAGGKPVSWEIAFRYRGTHFAYITSHVNKLTDLSPGRLHMDLSQRAALAAGQIRFDLMVPYDLHKESWSSAMVNVNDYYYPATTLGRLYGAAYLRAARPIIRKIYYKLPQKALLLLQSCCAGIRQ
jgi:CelD/BcsL family acetyltransferase involved in cellulose biosynthesis